MVMLVELEKMVADRKRAVGTDKSIVSAPKERIVALRGMQALLMADYRFVTYRKRWGDE